MTKPTARQIAEAVEKRRDLAVTLFDGLAEGTRDAPGFTRPSYGRRECFAHDLMRDTALALGLQTSCDASANTYMTLPGTDPEAPRIVTGSHLDSVRNGGNFDGAAGVVAGLVATAALSDLGFAPARAITTMGVRAEESVWFQVSYLGSRGALGMLPDGALDMKRIDTGRSAAEHIADCGGDPDALRNGVRHLHRDNVACFMELHIEQAPTLVGSDVPVGICTGVPGLFMYPAARVLGEYGHVGTPRRYRHDAAMAAAEFAMMLDREWERNEGAGRPMAITFGRFHTDPEAHALTTIAGEFRFSVDIRAYDPAVLEHMQRSVEEAVAEIEARRGVRFELGRRASAAIGFVDPGIVEDLQAGVRAMSIPAMLLNSPASHDAGAFSAAGIPTGMIFVRNRNGSHNPHEEMEIDDFMAGVRLLAWWLVERSLR